MKTIVRSSRLFTYALLLALPVWFASCGKNGGDDPVAPNTIEGNWKIKAMRMSPGVDVPGLGKVTDLLAAFTLSTQSTCLGDITFNFKSDGTLTSSNPSSCQANLGQIQSATGIDISGTSRWTLTGDQLTVTSAGGAKQTTTAKVDGNAMTWTYKGTIAYTGVPASQQDITIEFGRAN